MGSVDINQKDLDFFSRLKRTDAFALVFVFCKMLSTRRYLKFEQNWCPVKIKMNYDALIDCQGDCNQLLEEMEKRIDNRS